jgi:hypothetical protein
LVVVVDVGMLVLYDENNALCRCGLRYGRHFLVDIVRFWIRVGGLRVRESECVVGLEFSLETFTTIPLKNKHTATHIASNCLTTLVVDPHEIKVNIAFGFTVRSL